MKSFYQFYESISTASTNVYVVYREGVFSIEKVYVNLAQANTAANKFKNGTVTLNTYIEGSLPHNGDEVYVILITENYDGKNKIYEQVYTDKNEAKTRRDDLVRFVYGAYFWTITLEQTTFVTTSKSLSKPKSPTNPYSNLKYPLIGELTHYLSTQNLYQEIYHTMRDKSQKSINLLNYLRALINKIELV